MIWRLGTAMRAVGLGALVGWLFSTWASAAEDRPQAMTGCYDLWPPYTQADGSGITPALVAAVAAKAEIRITLTQMPWKRCLTAVEQGVVTFALDAVPRAGYLRSELAVTHIRSGVFAVLGRFSELGELASLPEVRVGRPLGWSNWETVADKMPAGPMYTTVQAGEAGQMMDMLRHGRIDVYVDDVLSARRLSAQHGVALTTLLIPPEGTDLYLLFGLSKGRERALWDQTMDALKGSGWLEEHFRRNGMM